MVDVLMLASFGNADLEEFLALSREYDLVRKERVQSFFSSRTIYDATAFTQINGNGDETAYLGHVIVSPNGRLGFDPSVVLGGDVNGVSIHDVLAAEIAARHGTEEILANLLAGDDVVVGNGVGARSVAGYGGDDTLLATGFRTGLGNAYLSGGAGDDLLFSIRTAQINGGEGVDTFVINSREPEPRTWFVTDLEHGIDQILFDRKLYPDFENRITKDELVYGSAAMDAGDRIILEDYGNPGFWRVYVDADGAGPAQQQVVGYIHADDRPTFRDFGTVNAAKLMPDIFDLFGQNVTPRDVFGADFAEPQATFAHTGASLLPHHGLIQLV